MAKKVNVSIMSDTPSNSYIFPEWGITVTLKQNYDIIKDISKYCSNSYYKNFKSDMPPALRQFVCKFPETYVIGISWESTRFDSEYHKNDIAVEIAKQLVLLSNFKWLNESKTTCHLVNNKQAFRYCNPCYIIMSNGTLETSTRDCVTTAIPFSFYYDVKVVDKVMFEKTRKQYCLDDDIISQLQWSFKTSGKSYKREDLFMNFCNELSSDSLEFYNWKFWFGHGKTAIKQIAEMITSNVLSIEKADAEKIIRNRVSEIYSRTARFDYDYNLFGIVAIIITDSDYDFEIMHSTGLYQSEARKDFINRVKAAQNKPGYVKTILINYDTQC